MSLPPNGPRIVVEPDLLASILAPYRPECRYLRSAVVDVPHVQPDDFTLDPVALARASGEFSIPESCYIDATGHFNSVEFNICYNQLVYVLMAQCVVSKLVPSLSDMTIDEYRRRQLPDVLIHEFSSVFKRQLSPDRFVGEVRIDHVSSRGRFIFLRTSCRFRDDAGGLAQGEVTLAIVDRRTTGAVSARRSGSDAPAAT